MTSRSYCTLPGSLLATSFCISSQRAFISSLLPGLARNFTTIVSVLAGRAGGLAAWGSAADSGRVRAMRAAVRISFMEGSEEVGDVGAAKHTRAYFRAGFFVLHSR